MASRAAQRNPTGPRLNHIAMTYQPVVAYAVAQGWAEATGRHSLLRKLRDTYRRGGDHQGAQLQDWFDRHNPTPETRTPGPAPSKNLMAHTLEKVLRAYGVYEEHTRFDRYLPALAQMFNARLKAFASAKTEDEKSLAATEIRHGYTIIVSEIRAIVDWAAAENINLPAGLDLEAASVEAEEWGDAQDALEGGVPQGEVLYSFDDGWTVQKLDTPRQLEAEGAIMQHCLDGYEVYTSTVHARLGLVEDRITSPAPDDHGDVFDPYAQSDVERQVEIYSLRDPNGHPHATMEWKVGGGYVSQLKGKQNAAPKIEYLERMVTFRCAVLHAPAARRAEVKVIPRLEWGDYWGELEPSISGVYQQAEGMETSESGGDGQRVAVFESGLTARAREVDSTIESARKHWATEVRGVLAKDEFSDWLSAWGTSIETEDMDPYDRWILWLMWQADGLLYAEDGFPDEMVQYLVAMVPTVDADALRAKCRAPRATNPKTRSSELDRHASLKRRLMR